MAHVLLVRMYPRQVSKPFCNHFELSIKEQISSVYTSTRTSVMRMLPQVRQANPDNLAFWSSWKARLQVASGAAAGVQHMHSQDVVHSSLSSMNLVRENATLA